MAQWNWDTWIVPTQGGEPQLWLRNASSLTWTGPRQVLFSEKRSNGGIGIVTAQEGRIGQRDVYIPLHDRGMAQRSLRVARWEMGAAGGNHRTTATGGRAA